MVARRAVLLCAVLICAIAFVDLAAAQKTKTGAKCPSNDAVLASFSALSSKCTALTKQQKDQLTNIGQFIASAVKFAKEGVPKLKMKPNDLKDAFAKLLPDPFLNNMIASVGSVNSNVRVASNSASGGAFLETDTPGSLNPTGDKSNSAGTPACNDPLLKALSSASCQVTGVALLDQLIGGFAGAVSTSAAAVAKLGEWSQMIDAQVAAIEELKSKKPQGYEAPSPARPNNGPAKPAPGAPATGSPRVAPKTKPGSFLQLHSQRMKSRLGLQSEVESPNFPTIYQDAGAWITRIGCNDATAAADMAVIPTWTNGCSVPTGWYLYIGTFTDACQVHDMCYGCPGLSTRRNCDGEFYDNMIDLCADKYCWKYLNSVQRGFCYRTAVEYWLGVRAGGGFFSSDTDEAYCARPCPARMARFRMTFDDWC